MANGNDLVRVALSQVGTKEYPANSNRQKYGAWYGMNGAPWCDMFVSWCAAQAGVSNYIGGKFAYCPYHVNWFKQHGLWKSREWKPQPGDIIFFGNRSGVAQHVGIVERRISSSAVATIEGNTSGSGSQANGGMVMRKTRYYGRVGSSFYILGFGHPNWSSSSAFAGTTSSYPTMGERSDRVRQIQKMLIALGYNCGRYGADGEWGADTRSACIKFQQNHTKELGKPDGLAGPKTQGLLRSLYNAKVNKTESNVRSNIKAGYDPWVAQLQTELIRQGYARRSADTTDGIAGMVTLKACPQLGLKSKGNLTKLVQKRIKSFGYTGTLEIDGINGTHTHAAIKWFQRSKGLAADAIVGRATWAKLLKL